MESNGRAVSARGLRMRVRRFFLAYDAMGELRGGGGHVRLGHGALTDLRWWARLPDEAMERPLWQLVPTVTLHTDSSGYAWGGVVGAGEPDIAEARGTWTQRERESHITALELRAVTQAMECLASRLRAQVVRHFEDNQAVVGVLGALTSPSPAMMAELEVRAAKRADNGQLLWVLKDMADLVPRSEEQGRLPHDLQGWCYDGRKLVRRSHACFGTSHCLRPRPSWCIASTRLASLVRGWLPRWRTHGCRGPQPCACVGRGGGEGMCRSLARSLAREI